MKDRLLEASWAIDRYGRAMLKGGWLWLSAGLLVLINNVYLLIDVARGTDPVLFVVPSAVLLVVTSWCVYRAHTLARQNLNERSHPDPHW